MIILISISCNDSLQVKSPDKNNCIALELNGAGKLFFSIQSHGIQAIEKSVIGMDIADSLLNFNSGLDLVETRGKVINETYTLPTGKTSTYVNKANESDFIFKNKYNRLLHVICHAGNDGVAFRYIVESPNEITIKKENTHFIFPRNTLSWIMNYVPHFENFYQKRLLDTIGIKSLSYPALVQIDSKLWMLLTEASVYDQPATHLKKTGAGTDLEVEFPEAKYSIASKWESPWDEIRFIDGYPGDYVCLARRKGEKWFIAGINSERGRTVDIPLNFIGKGNHTIEIYEDKPGEEMTNLTIRNETVSSLNTLSVRMISNGGFCTIIE